MQIGAVLTIIILSAVYGACLNIWTSTLLIKRGHIPGYLKKLGLDYTEKDTKIRELLLRSDKKLALPSRLENPNVTTAKENMKKQWRMLKDIIKGRG